MSVSWPDSLRHVLDEIAFISDQLTHTDEDLFMHDPTLQRAFVRSLKLPAAACGEKPESPPKTLRQPFAPVTLATCRSVVLS